MHEDQQELAATTHSSKMKPPKNLNEYERRLFRCYIPPSSINVRFNDIASLQHAKQTLHELISLPLQRPDIFHRGILRQSVSGILLFGPPGTGKTMLAKAVATESGSNFLSISMSDIMEMYVGQGEKNAKAVFTLARKLSPCLVFFDEVDSLFSARGSHHGYTTKREVLNEIMTEWDGLQSSHHQNVIVMAATNRPFDLDEAVLRRLPRRVFVDLPDINGREQMLRLLLKDEELSNDVQLRDLAAEIHNYSGSDLKNLCLSAAMNSVREHLRDPYNCRHRVFLLVCVILHKPKQALTPSLNENATILQNLT